MEKVTISATQKQTEPNQTLHLGESGDWGIATANKTGAGAYYFRLNHKSTVLVFQPFNSATSLQSCVIQKIVVTSDNDIAGTYTVDTTTGQLKNDGSGKKKLSLQHNVNSYQVTHFQIVFPCK